MVYLLHFSRRYEHARHFVGVARDAQHLEQLLADPATHTRAPLLIAAHAAGVRFTVAGIFDERLTFARSLKASHDKARFCDVCSPPAYRERRA